MLFNSFAFLFFFPFVVIVYWVLKAKFRNIFLLLASYYFYMNWQPIYAILIFISTIITWLAALGIEKYNHHKKIIVASSITINIGILAIYKYAGFFSIVMHDALSFLGIAMEVPQFTLLLPVGISFYTFQAIGYTIDVYREKLKPERNLMTYALFVSFFPQLVAGPIERASNLLRQFHEKHVFDYKDVITGMQMMLWGYFMKLCIADNVSSYVDAVFNHLAHHNGTSILLASFFFTFQIFCDFGGYSLIAIGCARCLGFRLITNFKRPYLSGSIKDFWRRWHISLSSWFMEYVYIPLGGNRCSKLKHKRNLIVTFLVSGLWHGANYTYVVWGAYHGLLITAQSVFKDMSHKLPNLDKFKSSWIVRFFAWGATLILCTIGWIFFRANSIGDAGLAISKIVTQPGPLFNGAGKPALILSILLIGILMVKEIREELAEKRGEEIHFNYGRSMLVSSLLFITILLCGNFEGGQFIYFQF